VVSAVWVVVPVTVSVSWPLKLRLWDSLKPSAASGPVRLPAWLWLALSVAVAVRLSLLCWLELSVLLTL
jgi:hypothetical protein